MVKSSPVSSNALTRHVVSRDVLVEGTLRVGQVVTVRIGEASVSEGDDPSNGVVATFRFWNPDVSSLAKARL
jgi:hypothetical protein